MADLTALPGFVRAARRERGLAAAERLDRGALEAQQSRDLARIVAHAGAHSPFYRELYGASGVDERTPLAQLPVVDKPQLMARFDDWVTDPRATLAAAQAQLDSGRGDLLAGEFSVLGSGGSSRQPGVYVFSRDEWATVMAAVLRAARWTGITPRLPRRRRVAFVQAPGMGHMAARVGAGLDVGVHRVLRLPATMPRAELSAALRDFRPDALTGYASIIALLAGEQIDGRLDISPSVITTSSEPATAEMARRIERAWGVSPFDLYATTETGSIALDCAAHQGRHVFEDLAIVEVVDADDQPVPDGQAGHHLLVTNLFNRTQPFIRYRLSDMTAYQPGICTCGSPFRRLAPIDGRVDDVLELRNERGEPVDVHPTTFAPLFALPGVAELEVVQRGDALHLTVVPTEAGRDPAALAARVTARAESLLAGCGCATVRREVVLADALQRNTATGKIKLVRREHELARVE